MSKIEKIINNIAELIENAPNKALSKTEVVINKDELIGLLYELKNSIPGELDQSRRIILNEKNIIDEAKKIADDLRRETEEYRANILDEHTIMQKAYDEADKLIEDANLQARDITERAIEESNIMKQGIIKYSESVCEHIGAVIKNAIETTNQNHSKYLEALNENFLIVQNNIKEVEKCLTDK